MKELVTVILSIILIGVAVVLISVILNVLSQTTTYDAIFGTYRATVVCDNGESHKLNSYDISTLMEKYKGYCDGQFTISEQSGRGRVVIYQKQIVKRE